MSDEGWTVCVDLCKQKRNQRRIEKEQYPHMVRAPRAHQLQRKLNIDNLVTTLLEDTAHQLQIEGWIYTRVLRPTDLFSKEDGWEYTTIDNFNKWEDKILFRRIVRGSAPATDGDLAADGLY